MIWNARKLRTLSLAILVGAFFALWLFVFIIFEASNVIKYMGIENSYITLFIISLVGGFTSLTSVSAYPALVAAVTGGLQPVLITLVAGGGLIVGDLLFFLFAKRVRFLLPEKYLSIIESRIDLDSKYVPVLIFAYFAFTPFPNNVLTAWLALKNYKLRRLIVPLVLGDLTLPLITTCTVYLGMHHFMMLW